MTNQSAEKTIGLLFFGWRTSLALDTSSICSLDPFRPIKKQQTIGLCEPQTLRSRGDRVSLCVREPQTAPQSPRMGGHRFEKTWCWIDPRTEAATLQSVPRSLAWEGRSDDVTGSDMAVKPEVHKTHYIEVKIMFFCLMDSRQGPGYKRDVGDVLVTSRPWV